jgi:general secretion pathway protein J
MRNKNRAMIRRRADDARRRGFTLIELLAAISILAIVALLGWRGLDGIVRARVALTADMEQTRGMQLAFAQLQSDCAQLVTTATIPNRSPLVTDKDRLMLVRSVFAENQPTRLQVVTYLVKDGVLTRRESIATRDLRELDNLWMVAVGDKDKTQAVKLQTGVSAMQIRLWANDNTGWRSGDVDSVLNAPGPAAATPGTPPAQISHSAAMNNPMTGFNQRALTGLEVSMQLEGREGRMVKIFLLGAV